jgi:molecular chaperone DnaK
METILGIDLGTTNSVAAVYRNGRAEVLDEDGERLLPSVVGLDEQGQLLVGTAARNQYALEPQRTVRSIKRKMGEDVQVRLGDQQFSPQEVSSIILRELKRRAEARLGHAISKAVITVPAFFTEVQREATRQAGQLAGFEVARLINEPTAASLAYDPKPSGRERLLVYDLGGGTFDVSIVEIEQGVVEVLASHGDTHLGGDDFDQLLLDHVCDRFQAEHVVDLRASLASRSRVLHAVEEAKKKLSFEPVVMLEEEFIAESKGQPLHLRQEIHRHEYEALIEPLLLKTLVSVDEALDSAKLHVGQIDQVVLVGGATRTPLVQHLLADRLRQPLHLEVDPDLGVALGAAVQAGMLAGEDVGPVLVDITPYTLGIRTAEMLDSGLFTTHFSPVIHRNTTLPASRSELYATMQDGQRIVQIEVYQGEDHDIRGNQFVGQFMLDGLADVSQGNEVLVRFDLDASGILKVSAIERATGNARTLVIDNAMERLRQANRAPFDPVASIAVPQIAASFTQPAAADEDAGQSLEFADVREDAEVLLRRAGELMKTATEADIEDLKRAVAEVEAAIAARSESRLKDATAVLEDLVFYLHDA